MHHLESAAIRSLLLLMANWFLVQKYATCQSRKSDFGWYRFNCAAHKHNIFHMNFEKN